LIKNQPPVTGEKDKGSTGNGSGGVPESFYRFFFAVERVCGAAAVPWLMSPYVLWSVVRRRKEYHQFARLRNTQPPAFWKGISPRRHYFKMIRVWHEFLGMAVSYHRLGLPYWQARVEVKGTPPDKLPEWGARPVILAFLHTGTFGMLRFWMRARKIPTASLIVAMPAIVDNPNFQKYLDAGDKSYGLEGVPHMFRGATGLRNAIRFLKPGHVLTMALDGSKTSSEADRLDAGGIPIYVKQGACRVAAQTNALVVPAAVRRTSASRYEVRFGKPVPDELIQKEDFTAATQHLISELWPDIQKDPSDLNWTSLEALAPTLQTGRTGWP